MLLRRQVALVSVAVMLASTLGTGVAQAAPPPPKVPASAQAQAASIEVPQSGAVTPAPTAAGASQAETDLQPMFGKPDQGPRGVPIMDTANAHFEAAVAAAKASYVAPAPSVTPTPPPAPSAVAPSVVPTAVPFAPLTPAAPSGGATQPAAAGGAGSVTPATAGYSVSGTVTSGGGTPLAGIVVTDYCIPSAPDTVCATVTTGGDGAYLFSSTIPATHTILFVDPTGIYAPGVSCGAGCYSIGGTSVGVNGNLSGLDISLPIARHLSGTVTDTKSSPIADIKVSVQDTTTYASATTWTAADGTYSFSLPDSTYSVMFYDPSALHLIGCYNWPSGLLLPCPGSPIVVGVAGASGIDGKLATKALISGTVTGSDGPKLSNLEVEVMQGQYPLITAMTASDGSFAIPVFDGAYTLRFYDATSTYLNGYWGASGFVYNSADSLTLSVSLGDIIIVNVVDPVWPRIEGTVTNTNQQPLAGIGACAEVIVSSSYVCYPQFAGPTDSNGKYSLRVLPGTYYIGVGSSSVYVGGFYTTSGFDRYNGTRVVVGTTNVVGLDVTLPAYIHLSGRVTAGGSGVANLQVHLYPALPYITGGTSATTDANGDYSFSFDPLAAGNVIALADGTPGYVGGWYSTTGWVCYINHASPIAFTADVTGIDIVLPTARTIGGTTTTRSGVPIVNGYVGASSIDNNSGATTYSDQNGHYTLVVPPGQYYVQFAPTTGSWGWWSSSGFVYDKPDASPVDVTSSNASGIDAAIPTAWHIKGRVTNQSSAGISGIRVDAFGPSASDAYAYTASDGTYSIDVVPGSYMVFASGGSTYASGYYSTSGWVLSSGSSTRIPVVYDDVAGINLSLPLAHQICGTVKEPTGTAASSFFVEGWVDGTYYSNAYTDSNGAYCVVVVPGSARLWMFDSGGIYSGQYAGGWYQGPGLISDRNAATAMTISTANLTGKNVTLANARHVKGRITYGNSGLAGIYVDVDVNGWFSAYAITAADGTYSVPVSQGSYQVLEEGSASYVGGYRTSSNGLTADLAAAATLSVSTADVSGINIAVPAGYAISGTVTTTNGARLSSIEVDAYLANGTFYTAGYTIAGGTFSLLVPAGSYKLGFYDGTMTYASGWFATAGLASYWANAEALSVGLSNLVGKDAVLPKMTHPDAPTGVRANPFNKSAEVSWSAPLFDGGAPIGSYKVTASPGGATCTTTGMLWCYVMGLTNGTPYSFTVSATNPNGTGPASASSAQAIPFTGATYFPLVPTRILDSRTTVGNLQGKFTTNVPRTFQVTGHGNVPVNATAVTGNLTVTGQGAPGFLYIGPVALASPTSSTLNFPVGDDRANAVTVALGTGNSGSTLGSLSITYIAPWTASADAIFDVTGYFLPDQTGATYFPLEPARILDSRTTTGDLEGKFDTNVPRTFQVTGHGSVPDNATAVTGNLTVTGQSAFGYFYMGPDPIEAPGSSTLNFPMGDNRANAVTVALSSTGTLSITYVAPWTATADAIFDVTGYFVPGPGGATYFAFNPKRILDSRTTVGGLSALATGVARSFQVAGPVGVPTNATAVTGNLTVTLQGAYGYLYLGPVATDEPTSSTLNFPPGDNRANAVFVALGAGGTLSITYVAPWPGPTTHAVFDVTGFFAPIQ
jgi:serine protease inhibitor ecotin